VTMNRLSLSTVARIGAVGIAAATLIASTEAGDRAVDGTCPVGETCSPDTPDGLLFEGAPLGFWPDISAHTIAAGGRQTFHITDAATDADLALPFVAATSIAGFSAAPVDAAHVTVAAGPAATGYLRIVSPEGSLYDRLSIDSAEITTITAVPAYAAAYPSLLPAKWAAFAGGRAAITVKLTSNAAAEIEHSVVDESLVVRAPVAHQRLGWDTIALTPAAAGIVELNVDAGHLRNQAVAFTVVDTIGSIVAPSPVAATVGREVTVCFHALTAEQPDPSLVIGVPWQFTTTGPAQLAADQAYPACVKFTGVATGTVTVTARAVGLVATATVNVSGASAKTVAPSWLWLGTAGERAATVSE
jgi:hypothetical protein